MDMSRFIKILLIGLAIVLGYGLIINRLAFLPRLGITQNQDNIIRIESELYRESCGPIVVLGSSIAARMNSMWMSNQLVNLSVKRSGPETGFQLLGGLPNPPRLVVVELNCVYRQEDKNITSYFNAYPFEVLRRNVPVLWQRNHILNVLYSLECYFRGTLPDDVPSVNSDARSQPELEAALKIRFRADNTVPDAATVEMVCNQVKSRLRDIQAKGCRIAVAWFPMDVHVTESPNSRAWLQALHQALPEGEYSWLKFPEEFQDRTSDGVHLLPRASFEASQWLLAECHKLL